MKIIIIITILVFVLAGCAEEAQEENNINNHETFREELVVALEDEQTDKDIETQEVSIYVMDANTGGIVPKQVEASQVDEQFLWAQLQEANVLSQESTLLSMVTTEEGIILDVDSDFGEYIRSVGATEAMEILKCLEWTYIDVLDVDKVEITEEGSILEIGMQQSMEQGYSIVGISSVTTAQLVKYFESTGHRYPSFYANTDAPTLADFCRIYVEEAKVEGIRVEVVFTQAMKETGFLKYGGDVKIGQFNFAGLGAVGGGAPGESYQSVRMGARAQIQHLKGYATTSLLVNEHPQGYNRFKYLADRRGSIPVVEGLAIPAPPVGIGWAVDPNYGHDLVHMINELMNR